jgi:cytochrome c1
MCGLISHRVLGKFAAAATAGGAALVLTAQTAHADSDVLHPTVYPWSHTGAMAAYDAASIRRGHQVYAEVCAACHGLKRIAYRNLVGVCYTEEEAKQMAADKEYQDGPDDTGELADALMHARTHRAGLPHACSWPRTQLALASASGPEDTAIGNGGCSIFSLCCMSFIFPIAVAGCWARKAIG